MRESGLLKHIIADYLLYHVILVASHFFHGTEYRKNGFMPFQKVSLFVELCLSAKRVCKLLLM